MGASELSAVADAGPLIHLTDDLAVRDAASRLGLTPVGSLGVVMKACVKGLTSYDGAEERILELHKSSTLFVTQTIVDLALERLRASVT